MADDWARLLIRWTDARLIDAATAVRIRVFEHERAGATGLGWPIRIALVFGALMLGAGVLLFVSAHWDTLPPQVRFGLVLTLVAVFHASAAAVAERFAGMAEALHAVGTIALGAGVFLTGQIFNLDEHWPSGLMLWTFGAGIGWALLRQKPQLALALVLGPAWLCAEWIVAADPLIYSTSLPFRVMSAGTFLLALAYFTAIGAERSVPRNPLIVWIGGIMLVPPSLGLAVISSNGSAAGAQSSAMLSTSLRLIGWSVALGLPLVVAVATRRLMAWPHLVATLWVAVLLQLHQWAGSVSLYAWWALGAIALVAWGVREARRERINLGAAMFAATVLTFYFSQVLDKLNRSASLAGFGILFLAGGWALERVRRRLVRQTEAPVARIAEEGEQS